MKILLLTQWFDPEPFFKGLPFAKELQKRGHAVEVLTGVPNYPGGKVYPGYRVRLWQREIMEGIRVNRLALYPSHDRSGSRRIANYLSFALSALLFGLFLVRKPDVVYVYNLITLAATASLLRKIHGCKIVYDVQDLWPESVALSEMMRGGLLHNILRKWSRWAYNQADAVVVLSPGFKENLVQRGIAAEKISVIYNWAEEGPNDTQIQLSEMDLRHIWESRQTFKVVFAGTMGIMQGLDTIVDAAGLCKKTGDRIVFILIGDGVALKGLKEKVAERHLVNVHFISRKPAHEIGTYLQAADALLVHLKNNELFKITIPSKTQAYLKAGKPIIMAVAGDACSLIEQAQAGVWCEPENAEAIAGCARRLSEIEQAKLDQMGECGRHFYATNLSMRCGVNNFEKLFTCLLAGEHS